MAEKQDETHTENCCICLQTLDIYQEQVLDQNQQTNLVKYDYFETHPDSCKHQFHRSCIITWLKQNTKCPVCQSEILWITIQIPEELIQEYKDYRQGKIQVEKQGKPVEAPKKYEEVEKKVQVEEIQKEENESPIFDLSIKITKKHKKKLNQQKQNNKQAIQPLTWQDDVDIIKQQQPTKKQGSQQQEFPELGGQPEVKPSKQEEEQKEQEKQENYQNNLDLVKLNIELKLEGNSEIVTIQEINEFCKMYQKKSEKTESVNELNLQLEDTSNLTEYEIEQLKQLSQSMKNGQEQQQNKIFDHNFLRNELNALSQKFRILQEHLQCNQGNLDTIQGLDALETEDFLWFIVDKIKNKLKKIRAVCNKMIDFNCQEMMQDFDTIDKQIEWCKNGHYGYLYDHYSYDFKKKAKKNDQKIVWDYQTEKVPKKKKRSIDNQKQQENFQDDDEYIVYEDNFNKRGSNLNVQESKPFYTTNVSKRQKNHQQKQQQTYDQVQMNKKQSRKSTQINNAKNDAIKY